jgi:hypothetical protein
MPKFDIRFVQMVPVWAYADVEAKTIDDALDMLEDNPEEYIYEVDMHEEAPGFADYDIDCAEVKDSEGNWKPA